MRSCVLLLLVLSLLSVFTRATANERALRHSARKGRLERIQQLIDAGASVNAQSRCTKRTPLMLATRDNHLCTMRLLISAGANPNIPDFRGVSPLQWAASNGRLEAAKILVDIGARDGAALGAAAQAKDRCMALLLVRAGLASLEALRRVIFANDVEGMQILLDVGVDVNAHNSGAGTTLLHCAVRSGHRGMVRLLLSRGARANAVTSWGETVLKTAVLHGRLDIIQLLLCAGAKISTEYHPAGGELLIEAINNGRPNVAHILIRDGADVAVRWHNGYCLVAELAATVDLWRPVASRRKREKMMFWLVKRGAPLPRSECFYTADRGLYAARRLYRRLTDVHDGRIATIKRALDERNVPQDLWWLILQMVYGDAS